MELTEIIPTSSLHISLALFIGIVTAFYVYLTWHFNYWKKQGVKGDKPWPFIGTLTNHAKVPLEVQDKIMYEKYGRVFGIFEGRQPALYVAEPDLLKTILVKDFNSFRNRRVFPVAKSNAIFKKMLFNLKDNDWKELRTILTPAFSTGKLKQMVCLIEECANDMMKGLRQHVDKNEPFEARNCFSAYTMDVIATCAFGTKLNSLAEPDNEFIKQVNKFFIDPPKTLFIGLIFPQLVDFLPPFILLEPLRYLDKLVHEMITLRKQESVTRKDFLQVLIEAKKDGEKKKETDEAKDDRNKMSKFEMTHDYLVAQAMSFFFAGYDTTIITLTFVIYNLVVHENVQEKLIREIDKILNQHKGVMNYEAIADMQYLEMVIAETLRLHPLIFREERICEVNNYNLNGIILKKGMLIGIPYTCLHYDEEFFPNPTVFEPERFAPENRSKINPYTYLPFGYGPRSCIGMRFSQIQIKIALVSILRNYRVKRCAETVIPFKRKSNAFILQPESLKLLLEPRNAMKAEKF